MGEHREVEAGEVDDHQRLLRDAELAENLRLLREEGSAVIAVGKHVVLCDTREDVKAALAGKLPPGAARRNELPRA